MRLQGTRSSDASKPWAGSPGPIASPTVIKLLSIKKVQILPTACRKSPQKLRFHEGRLNRIRQILSPVPVTRKPLDIFVEGLDLSKNRSNKI